MKINKNKKNSAVATLCAVVMGSSAFLFPFSGCKDTPESTCEHNVGSWTLVTDANCASVGVEEGICSVCFEKVTRDVSIKADAHTYGEWQVTVPTEEATGVARRVCANNAEHYIEQQLPVISEEDYGISITKLPTAGEDGERTYVYAHSMGNIVFTRPLSISEQGVETVRDAVEIASSAVCHDLIRRSEGVVGYEYHCPAFVGYTDPETGAVGTRPAEDQIYHHEYMYEFGDDYTHIGRSSYDDTERWYGIENGEVFGFAESLSEGFYDEISRGIVDAENYIDGFRFAFMYAKVDDYYGAENFLAGLYKTARLSENGDFKESIKKKNGETWYTFQFGSHDGNIDDGSFDNVRVEFTMSEEYTINEMKVQTVVYRNNAGLDDSTGGQFDTWELVDQNGKQIARVKEGRENGPRYIEVMEIGQWTKEETVDEPIPENPYAFNGAVYDSFDVKYNGAVLGAEDKIDCIATQSITISLDNLKPQSAVTSGKDSFRYYYRDKSGNDHAIDYASLDTVGLNVYNNVIRSKIAGEVQVVIKTARLEKVITLNVAPIAPTGIYPTVFEYTRSGYFANKMSTVQKAEKVYVGQPLYFMPTSSALEEKYTDPSGTATVTSGNANACTLTDKVESANLPMSIKTAGVANVSSFVATEPGTYTVTMACTMNPSVTCSIQVIVEEAPTIDDILSGGSYMQELTYPVKGKVAVTFTKNAVTNIVRANVSFNGRDTALLCNYNDGKLTTSMQSGGGLFDDTVYNFSLTLNEAYDLVLSHPIGSDFGDLTEDVILRRDINEILTGNYEGSFDVMNEAERVTLTFDNQNEDKKLRAVVSYGDVNVTLICEYSITQDTLTSTVERIEGGEFTMSLTFDKAYRLMLTKTVGEDSQEILLTRVAE